MAKTSTDRRLERFDGLVAKARDHARIYVEHGYAEHRLFFRKKLREAEAVITDDPEER